MVGELFHWRSSTERVRHSVKPKSTWVLLKPQSQSLVSQFVFPQLCFNESKKELWRDDPVDYLRVTIGKSRAFQFFSIHYTLFLQMSTKTTKAQHQPPLPSY